MMAADLPMLLGIFSLGLLGAGWWLHHAMTRQDLWARRVAAVQRGFGADPQDAHGETALPIRLIAGLGALLARSGIMPAATLVELEHTLTSAGMQHRNGLALFVGGKVVLAVLLPSLAYLALQGSAMSPPMRVMVISVAAVVGLLLPDFILRRRRAAYLAAVSRGLPDALDMLVICSEAGLGLETGIERVSNEIRHAHPGIAAEFKTTCNELRILSDRRVALTNMGTRTGLDTIKRLASTLIQTMQYGTPLSQALRTLATEMRYEMLIRFEAQAARLPVLLTVPMILFILPCIFIIVGGPAGLTVARTLIHH